MYITSEKGHLPKRGESRLAKRKLEEYEGKFSVYGDVFIRIMESINDREGSLYFKVRSFVSNMEYYHFDAFKMFFNDSMLSKTLLMSFQAGQDGEIEGFKIELSGELLEFKKNIRN
ncbi:hypothetical protein BGZ49_001527 [Haplosporangium sp. Z 27]|nr:hypothetical protein BGZ49_001527 [Haplosporangium sp. Z 27]